MEFVNLTPHPIVIYKGGRKIREIPPSGKVLRLPEERNPMGEVDGIPVSHLRYGVPNELPPQTEDTIYIVSMLVLLALKGKRSDLVAPDTGAGAVRDENGRIIGTKGFVKV